MLKQERYEQVIERQKELFEGEKELRRYLNKKNGTIIFASPKINNSIMKELATCIDELQKIMHELGYEFKFELIANGDFQEKIIIPMLKESDEVADTSELFLRSYQMIKMFENTTNKNNLYKN